MKRLLVIFSIIVFAVSCTKVPISNRKQLNLLPESEMQAMALTSYNEFINTNKVVANSGNAQMVERVGQRISRAAEDYLKSIGFGNRVEGFKWEYHLVESPEVNAWCMPGGKIVVYTGILPYTATEEGLATVMGHEVAHAIARHGNERMSQELLAQAGSVALDVYLSQHPSAMNSTFQALYGVGAQVGVLLPYGRMQESEADRMGLSIMAFAGYNPNLSIDFWQRMKAVGGGNGTPTFLRTHPDDDKRIADLKAHMPEAMKVYKKR